MDIEKLIERMRSHRGALFKAQYKQDMDDAATALAALQDENTWLRIMREWDCAYCANQNSALDGPCKGCTSFATQEFIDGDYWKWRGQKEE